MKSVNVMASVLLAAVSLAHLLRVIFGVQMTVADRLVPMWPSAVAFVVAGALAFMLWRDGRRR